MISLTDDKNMELLIENIDSILDKVKDARIKYYDDVASDNDIKNVFAVINDYIKKKKRKIYGGYAINEYIKAKNPKDRIYNEEKYSSSYQANLAHPFGKKPHDIDFYSTKPIDDVYAICNELHDKGFKYVMGRDAMHKETYSIYVKGILFCDITYVPTNIYNKIPFDEIDGIIYTHPHWIMIDFLRIFNDPLQSYWRFKNDVYQRLYLLEKYYPLISSKNIKQQQYNAKALALIDNYLKNKTTTIALGYYVYKYYSDLTNIKYKFEIPFIEFISINYKQDGEDLMELLKNKFGDDSVTFEEYYPFFQFTGQYVEIFVDNIKVCVIYHYNNKSLPYIDIPIKGDFVRIGTFTLVYQHLLINMMHSRANNDKDNKQAYNTIITRIFEMRKAFLKNKTIFDKTPFQEFVVDTIGMSITPQMARQISINYKKSKGKPISFKYDPSEMRLETSQYIFKNSSGNKINNTNNLMFYRDFENNEENTEEIENID